MKRTLDKTTYGRAPAALYLVALLNQSNNQILVRKIGRFLDTYRRIINDIVACHYQTDEMKRSTFSSLLDMIDKAMRDNARCTFGDEHLGQLAVNVLAGEIKTLRRRSQAAAVEQRKINRTIPEGETPPEIKAFPMKSEPSESERIALLKAKSKRYLRRKGKIDTLY